MIATFMPKPFADRTGSGLHLHLSLTSGGTPVFPDADDDDAGSGLSPTAYAFIAGILEHACALQAVIAPTVNSYKRTGATTTASGASWAPRHADLRRQRPHPLHPRARRPARRAARRRRLGQPVPGRSPRRSAPGIDGIKRSLDPGAVGRRRDRRGRCRRPCCTRSTSSRPTRWSPASSTPPATGVAGYFAELKREEFFACHSAVCAWEIDQLPDRLLTRPTTSKGAMHMCGIVGLHLRNPELYPRLGRAAHRDAVRDVRPRQRLGGRRRLRRPDAGPRRAAACVSLLDVARRPQTERRRGGQRRSAPTVDRSTVGDTLPAAADVDSEALLAAVAAAYPTRPGRRLRRRPGRAQGRRAPARRSTDAGACAGASGWQGVGHTRMATESAVTPAGCHPYAVGPEQCLVHNGSFANHATIRRELRAAGVDFDSENDTEVGARFVAKQLADGPRRRDGAEGAAARRSTASTRCWCPTGTRSPWSATPSPASPPSSPRPPTGSRWPANTARCAGLPGVENAPHLGARAGGGLRMDTVTRHFDLRDDVRAARGQRGAARARTSSGEFVIRHPDGAHNVAVGVERAGDGHRRRPRRLLRRRDEPAGRGHHQRQRGHRRRREHDERHGVGQGQRLAVGGRHRPRRTAGRSRATPLRGAASR